MARQQHRSRSAVWSLPALLAATAIFHGCGPSYDATLVPLMTLPGTQRTVNVPKVARRGDVLYLCDENLGLSLWDVSRPEAPAQLERLAHSYHNVYKMEIEGDQLHVLAEHGPAVFDIRQPRSPQLVFAGGGARDVAVVQGYVYTAPFFGSVSLVELGGGGWRELAADSDIGALARVGAHTLLGVGRSHEARDNFIVWDVSSPAEPKPLYRGRVEGMLDDVAVSGDIAYVAAPDRGVVVFDLARPSAPEEIAELSGMTAFHAYVDAESRQLLVQANNQAVYVLDISQPRAPRPRAMYETSAAGVAAIGNGHFVVGSFQGVEVLRLQPR